MIFKTHNCNQISEEDLNKEVILSGWVNKIRKFKGKIFVDLRDRYGITQIVFQEKNKHFQKAYSLGNESVIKVKGKVQLRTEENKELQTGKWEVIATKLSILSTSLEPPLIIKDETDALEQVRFKYRYLDIRRKPILKLLKLRHKVITSIREFFNQNDFLEIETPILSKPTPEGARDYLVPSRVNSQKFYALPQSPQMYKQLLMIGGVDRYYQIAKCFRDEDLRSDRQPEFTQLDVEISFLSMEQILDLIEKMLKYVYQKAKNKVYTQDFKKITYQEAMEKYGSDKPDTRFEIYLNNVTKYFQSSSFKIFANAKNIEMIYINQNIDKKLIKNAETWAKEHNAKGLAWVKVLDDGSLESPIAKFIEEEIKVLIKKHNIPSNTTLLFVADDINVSKEALGAVRVFLAKKLNLFDQNKDEFLWVVNWPLFEKDKEGKITSLHHPFTNATLETIDLLKTNPLSVKAQSYDIIFNGSEIGGGSLRIFNNEIQQEVFKILGLNQEEITKQFGFFLEALKYGTPPHGGIAFGLDRFIMLLNNGEIDSIKEVIAFPKNSSAICPMSDSPIKIKEKDLLELSIKAARKKEEKNEQ